MSGLADLLAIIAKYSINDKQKLLNGEIVALADSILQPLPRASVPPVVYFDTTTVKVEASADSPAPVMMTGYPNVLEPSSFLSGGLSDGGYRANTAPVSMDFASAAAHLGLEKNRQWYAIFAKAGDADTTFTLLAVPYCVVKSQAAQVISLGQHSAPGTDIGYGIAAGNWDTDSLAGYAIYVLSGDSKGLVRTILHNNNSTTAGTIEYSGAALTLAQGDIFIILPNTNFRWLDDIYNDGSGNIVSLTQTGNLLFGKSKYVWTAAGTYDWFCPLNWPDSNAARVTGCGSGAGGESAQPAGKGGGAGQVARDQAISPVPGKYYLITIGAGGAANTAGNATSIGVLLSLAAGATGWSTGFYDAGPPAITISGPGQDGLFGGGGPAQHVETTCKDGSGPGAGGSGCVGTGTGGAGADGYLQISKEG